MAAVEPLVLIADTGRFVTFAPFNPSKVLPSSVLISFLLASVATNCDAVNPVFVSPVTLTMPGNTVGLGNDSVHVLFALKSCAPALDVIWFAVPATVMVVALKASVVMLVPIPEPTITPGKSVPTWFV